MYCKFVHKLFAKSPSTYFNLTFVYLFTIYQHAVILRNNNSFNQ